MSALSDDRWAQTEDQLARRAEMRALCDQFRELLARENDAAAVRPGGHGAYRADDWAGPALVGSECGYPASLGPRSASIGFRCFRAIARRSQGIKGALAKTARRAPIQAAGPPVRCELAWSVWNSGNFGRNVGVWVLAPYATIGTTT